jgi:hypothetical protein
VPMFFEVVSRRLGRSKRGPAPALAPGD